MTYQSAVVPMEPFGKARPRVTRGGTYMPREYIRARDALRLAFGPVTVEPPWALRVTAFRAMPASWSKRKRDEMNAAWCTTRPDADNVAGAVMDALFDDDASVVAVYCRKVWGEEGAIQIEVWTAADDAPTPF